jgi:ABC-type glutathione transport system ATPase component
MVIQSFVSFTILLFIDYRIISKFWYFIGCSGRTYNYLPNNSISTIVPIVDNIQFPNIAHEDEDVAEEAERIKAVCNHEIVGTDILVLNQVEKIYHGAFHAVDQISLGVKQGECFGLLGVNGA